MHTFYPAQTASGEVITAFKQLQFAPPGTIIDLCQQVHGSWYSGAILRRWHPGHLVIIDEGQEIQIMKDDLRVLQHQFVPTHAPEYSFGAAPAPLGIDHGERLELA